MKNSSFLQKALYGLLALVVFYFYFIHLKYAYSFPYNDEFRTIATVIIDYINADGFWAKMRVLLVNENESLQLFLKLTNIICYHIFGEIRYDILGYIGQISLLAFPLLVYAINKDKKDVWFDIALTILIVFNFQYYVLSFRHDTSFYYHVGLAGVLFSVYFWVKGNYTLMALFLLLGIFNNTSSVFILPVFVADYLTSARNLKKKYVLYGTLGFVGLLLFFYVLNPYLFYLPEGLWVTTKAFFIVLGNIIEIKYHFYEENPYYYSGVIYLLFVLYSVYYYYFRYENKSHKGKVYALIAFYLFISILAIAVKRSFLYHYLPNLLDPRYKMFTFTLLLFLILLWNEMKGYSNIFKWVLIFVFFIYNIMYAFIGKDYMRFLNQGARANSVSLKQGHDIMGETHINFGLRIYKSLDSLGLAPAADPEILDYHKFLKNVEIDLNKTPRFNADVYTERTFENQNYFTIQRIIANSDNKNSFIFYKSDSDVFLYPIDFYLKNSKAGFFKTFDYNGSLFYAYVYLSILKKGEYYMGLVKKNVDGSFELEVYPEKTIIDDKAMNIDDEFVD